MAAGLVLHNITTATGVTFSIAQYVPDTAAADVGAWAVTRAPIASTGTQSIVASSATDVTILAANPARLGGMIFNDSTAVLYLLFGSGTSSATVHSTQLDPGGMIDLPCNAAGVFTGVVKGIWASANGNARVTEFTA